MAKDARKIQMNNTEISIFSVHFTLVTTPYSCYAFTEHGKGLNKLDSVRILRMEWEYKGKKYAKSLKNA